jgi:translocation and assembly module TamA
MRVVLTALGRIDPVNILRSVGASALSGLAILAVSIASAPAAWAFDTLTFDVRGTDTALQERLGIVSVLRAAKADNLTDPFEVYTIARAEYGVLIGSFYEAGHFAPVISILIDGQEASSISPLSPPRQISEVRVLLDPGPAFVLGRAQIAPIAPGTVLPETFASGQVARAGTIRDAVGAGVDGWRDLGHAKAQPSGQQITARHEAQILDASIALDPGPRVTFGQFRADGADRTRPARITKIAGLPTGEVYSPAELQLAAQRLRDTGTFASVALRDAEQVNPDGSLDIQAALVEAPLRRLGAGIELDTESGMKLSGFWLHRNLLGGAERLRIEGVIGGIGARQGGRDYRLQLDFARPATLTPDTTLTVTALAETENERDFSGRRFRADIGLVHRFSQTLTGTFGVGVLTERAVFGPTRNLQQNYNLLLLPMSLARDTRDDPRSATSGTYLRGELKPFLGFSGADNGARATLDLRSYTGFGAEKGFVLAARAQIGAVFGASLDGTPRDFLFYSGGGGTVRGQPFRSLGVSPGGVASGGQGFAALSLEGRTKVSDKLGLVAFLDAGAVSERATSGAGGWHAGAGMGIRYDTDIGPLRLDVGMPVRGATGRGLQLYLGIGQSF